MKKLVLALILSTPLICSATDVWDCYGLTSMTTSKLTNTDKYVVCISENKEKVTGLLSCPNNYMKATVLAATNKPISAEVDKVNQFLSTTYKTEEKSDGNITLILAQLRLDLLFNPSTAKNLGIKETDTNTKTFEYFVKQPDQSPRMEATGTYKKLEEANCSF